MWKEFRDFIARGNVMDLAVGVIIGAAFGKIVTTLVEGILMPPIGLLLGNVDFSSLFAVLDTSKGVPTLACRRKSQGDSRHCLRSVLQRHHRLPDRGAGGVPDRQAGEPDQERRRQAVGRGDGNEGMPVLRIDDFDQGVALPELHLGARTSRASSLDTRANVTGDQIGSQPLAHVIALRIRGSSSRSELLRRHGEASA